MVSARCSQSESSLASHTCLVKIPYTPSLSSPLSFCICFLLLVSGWLLWSPAAFYPGPWICSCFSSPGSYITLGGRVSAHLQHKTFKAALNIQMRLANMWQVFMGLVWSDKQHLLLCSTGQLHGQSLLLQGRWEKSSCEFRRKKETDLVNSYADSTTLLSPVFSLALSLIFTFWPLHAGIIQQSSVIWNNFW